jgi:predicted MFS family arabinose efflux permease
LILPNPWLDCSGLPSGAAAALAALHLADPRPGELTRLNDAAWRRALEFCDCGRLTLVLREAARDAMPEWVRARTDGNARSYRAKWARIAELYGCLHQRLAGADIEYLALKGATHAALFAVPMARVQYDVDLYVPPADIERARDLLIGDGWRPRAGMEAYPTDHLPVMVRPHAWQFRGDYFDCEMPLPVELHFQFWNPRIERLQAPGTEQFWERRTTRQACGVAMGMLSPPDALGYAALHLLRHLLRGSVQPFHVYEIARLLDALAEHSAFWNTWHEVHSPGMRRLEAVVFRLAREWFGGHVAPAVEEEIARLPPGVQMWFSAHAHAPAIRDYHANKDELWLHLSLLDSWADRCRVARRRLFPVAPLPPSPATVLQRLRHHAVSLVRAIGTGVRWLWRATLRGEAPSAPLGSQFWWFLAAAAVFNFALFVFVLLYNLFLLDLGFHEDFAGVVNGAMRAGSVAGTLPAALVAHRLGLKRTLLATILATAAAEFLRAVVGARLPLAALAFLSGAIFSLWAVILAPMIAGAVDEPRRPAAFSVFFACMFAVGIGGNWLGGRLPLWMGGKRPVLIASAALVAAAVLPAMRLKEWPRAEAQHRVWPRNRFLALYLAPFALWHLATGTFNPFNNLYFARLGFSVERIGSVLSASQLAQIAALLAAPAIIRRTGLLGGIVLMMTATAFGLGALAAQPSPAAAVAAYAMYMSFQWMSEPGLNTLLMNHVHERERGGASALNYLVAFGAQAVAAFGGGSLFARMGYAWTLTGAAVLALTAAALFGVLLRSPRAEGPEACGAGAGTS